MRSLVGLTEQVPVNLPDEEEDTLSEDEEIDAYPNLPTEAKAPTGFTFNPLPVPPTATAHDRKVYLASLALGHGTLADKNAKIRFVIGVKEKNRPPGRRSGEKDEFKRTWRALAEFSRQYNWRKILSDDYDTDTPFFVPGKRSTMVVGERKMAGPQTFLVDGVEWTSVTHFMLGKLYDKYPNYSLLYSLAAKTAESSAVGFWGSSAGAKREHEKNILSGVYEPDPQFDQKYATYFAIAILAKFTQNPIAKKALLLTEDAVLSARGGPDGLLDLPILMEARRLIIQSPKMIYKGPNTPMEEDVGGVPVIISSEEINYGYAPDNPNNVAGSVPLPALYAPMSSAEIKRQYAGISGLDREELTTCDYWVYAYVGALNIKLLTDLRSSGRELQAVQRPIYAMEKVGDNRDQHLFIGIQKTATSLFANYLKADITISDALPFTLYIQPLDDSVGLFVVSMERNPQILDFLRQLMGYGFVPPKGSFTPPPMPVIQIKTGLSKQAFTRRFKPGGNLTWILNRVTSIKKIYTLPEIQRLNAAQRYEFRNALERLLISLADLNGEDFFTDITGPDGQRLVQKFDEELKAKKIASDGQKLVSGIITRIRTADSTTPVDVENMPTYANGTLRYGNYTLRVGEQTFAFLLGLAERSLSNMADAASRQAEALKLTSRMYLAYEMLEAGSQHWSLPAAFYGCVHNRFRIGLEAFANPMASNMISLQIPYCSVFDGYDRPFGSLGNLFRLDLPAFLAGRKELTVMINPPFINTILDATCELVDRWFEICAENTGLGVTLNVFFIAPAWTDANHYSWMTRHPKSQLTHLLYPRTYFYESASTREKIPASFTSLLSVLSNNKISLDKNALQECIGTLTLGRPN